MKTANNIQIKRTLHSLVALVATITMMLSCTSKQELAGTRWEGTEHDELRGGTMTSAIEFTDNSTGHFYILTIDVGSGPINENEDIPFTYTYNVSERAGKIHLQNDKNIYPFTLNDTALMFPGSRWQPIPYKQKK